MAIRICTRFTALLSSIALISLCLLTGSAAAKTKPVDFRVITSSGKTLAEYEQFTGATTAKADKRADCFGEDNPSSNKSYKLGGASTLSALIDAKSHDSNLSPLRLTDAFVDDGFGFGVCRIGEFPTSGFSYWYVANEYEAGTTGPDLIPVHSGDHVLWYLTNGNEPGFPNELELKAPVRAKSGEQFTVKVVRHLSDGSTEPAAGVAVGGGETGPDGKASLLSGPTDTDRLQATGADDDVPSNTERVCVANKLSDCSAHRGKTIYGSSRADKITGSKGKDKIGAGSGSDTINVSSGGPDKVVCGSGKDTVIRAEHQSGLVLKGCEKVKRRS